MNRQHQRVLQRNEAKQMITDLGDVMDTVISLAEEQDMSGKAMALDTLLLLMTKRNVLQTELACTDDEVTS